MIYLCHYNHDYTEWSKAFRNRAEAVADIAVEFSTESTPDSTEFWQEVIAIYESGSWKGFTFQTLDPITLEITEAPAIRAMDGVAQ